MLLKGLVGQIPLKKIGGQRPDKNSETTAITDEEREEIENRLIDYISENGGAITPSKAAEELGIPPDLVKELIERMTQDGRLTQTSESAAPP